MRQTKNLEIEINRFKDFSTKILAPLASELHTKEANKLLNFTVRGIQDAHGKASADCFVLLFKKKTRGGFSLQSDKGYKSGWEPNEHGLVEYVKWIEGNPEEMTARSLHTHLKNAGVKQLEWSKRGIRQYLDVSVVKAMRDAFTKKAEPEDKEDYTTMKVFLTK